MCEKVDLKKMHWSDTTCNIDLFLFQSDLNIVASYDRRGKHIYTGNAKGRVRDVM